jgi:hypothetical protein
LPFFLGHLLIDLKQLKARVCLRRHTYTQRRLISKTWINNKQRECQHLWYLFHRYIYKIFQ